LKLTRSFDSKKTALAIQGAEFTNKISINVKINEVLSPTVHKISMKTSQKPLEEAGKNSMHKENTTCITGFI
jgi:hypothetical protein